MSKIKLIYENTPDQPFKLDDWIECVRFCCNSKFIKNKFEDDTSHVIAKSDLLLLKRVDIQTGHDSDIFKDFLIWIKANIWGKVNLPMETND